jgi:hypothetical protein
VAQSKQTDLGHQFENLVELLKQERLSTVMKSQGEVQQELVRLLELLLSEDRTKRIESEKARIRAYLKRVNQIIKEQKSIQGETARDGDARKLADRQGDLSDKTAELAGDIQQDDAKKPSAQGGKSRNTPDGNPSPDGKPGEDDSDKANPEKKKSDDGDKKDPKDEKSGSEKEPDKRDRDHKKDDAQKEGDKKDADKADRDPSDKSDRSPKDRRPDQSGPKDQKSDKSDKGQPGEKSAQDSEGSPSKEKKSGQPKEDSGGQPGEGQSEPADETPPEESPAQKRLRQAQERMKDAQKKLEDAKRAEAQGKQADALKELEQAKAELEEILRQLREEETSRTLAMLESRFRKMLDAQVEVFEGTKRLDKVPQAQRDRDDEIEAGRMSRKEAQIATEADKALAVLREEGSAVAFPEAVSEMRDDMIQIRDRLAKTEVGDITQGIEKDTIAALEEMIASLQKAQKAKDAKAKQGQPPPSDADSEPPLVDTISELKMIRALQMRVNQRTQRYAELTQTEQTDKPDLLEALKRLAEREQKIHQVTRDIALGKNQ